MTRIQLEVPQGPTFAADEMSEEMSAERDACLLIAGAFPDKGLAISPEDLDGIVARFSAADGGGGVPVKVEHRDSPLDPLGLVKSVWRDGAALMGRLAFPPDLSGFLRRRGIAKLSVGLERSPLSLAEVSLVLRPRVASAALLSEGDDGRDAEIVRLQAELRQRTVDGQVASLKAQGRLLPSGEPWARALLSLDDDAGSARVTLSAGDAPTSVSSTFLRFLQSTAPQVHFGESAPGGKPAGEDGDAPVLTPAQEAFLRRTLGVDPAQVAATLVADQEAARS
ncbi:MAG: phage protease [Armatimonadota bacterium]|nr:phage protease [Armatimonadota bacterium]